MEEPVLPLLPSISWDEESQTFSHNSRKRVRPQPSRDAPPLNHNSSDPAIFSSDDDPALDNYVEGRRKKRYVGSWFQQHPTSSDSTFSETIHVPKQRRQWARQADSGVYLGSDGSESDDMLEILETPTRSKLPQLTRSPLRPVSRSEQTAREKIRTCIEKADETIDFWSMGLEDISNDTISPLSQFSCIPVVTKDVAFEQKEPELKIYLAMNRLMRLPGALFDLNYLTILSLRGNKLTEIPPAISKLHNLKELNVSQNRLRSLPIELLDLFKSDSKLHTLVLHPNPFFKPDNSFDDGLSQEEPFSSWPTRPPQSIQYNGETYVPSVISRSLGRSPVQHNNTTGRVLSDFQLPADYTIQTLPLEVRTHPTAKSGSESGSESVPELESESDSISDSSLSSAPTNNGDRTSVPSLLEIALRTCYSSSQLPEMVHYMPDGLVHLRQLLHRAVKQKQAGGVICSTCRRAHVVSIVEWIEWREVRTCKRASLGGDANIVFVGPSSKVEGERAVPFLHRGCSSRCGPKERMGSGWDDSESVSKT